MPTGMPPMLVPDFEVTVNGVRLSHEGRGDILSIHVEQRLDTLSMFTITMDNWDAEQQRITWSDSGTFDPGAEVVISLGWMNEVVPVMTGEVTGIEPRFGGDTGPTVTVRGYDLGHRLTRTWRTLTFAGMKESEIVKKIASEAGLRPVVEDSKVTLPHVMQTNQTDLDFLRSRARGYGWEVFVRDKALYFRAPATTGAPAHQLTVGAEIAEFSPRLSAMGQVAGVITRGWDLKRKQEISSTSLSGRIPQMGAKKSGPATAKRSFAAGNLVSTEAAPVATSQAQSMSDGRLARSSLGFVRGDASGAGRPRLLAGTIVRIDGAGTRFSGDYYVTAVTHTLDAETGFGTSFEVRRSGV